MVENEKLLLEEWAQVNNEGKPDEEPAELIYVDSLDEAQGTI